MTISRKSFLIIILFLSPLIITAFIYSYIRKPTIHLLNDESFVISRFMDNVNGGNSELNLESEDGCLNMQYTLHNAFDYPYAGLDIHRKDYGLFSLNKYKLRLVIDANEDMRLSVRFNQFLENYSSEDDYNTWPVFLKSFGLHKGRNVIEIQTKEINEVPDWWIQKNPEAISKVNQAQFDKTKEMWIFSEITSSTPLDKHFSLKIHEISMKYDDLFDIYLLSSILIIYYIMLAIFLWNFQTSKSKIEYVFTPINQIDVENRHSKILTDILSFIGSNYNNPELKLSDAASVLNITENTVSESIKQYTGKNFRQYLNHVRMEEAKRLLKESDLQISEIAFKVGYNNIQHFNRVFKEYLGSSPKSFRKTDN